MRLSRVLRLFQIRTAFAGSSFCYSSKMKAKFLLRTLPKALLRLTGVFFLSFMGPLLAQSPDVAAPATPPDKKTTEDFAAAADDVLEQMSQITGLKLREPLKKT